MGGRPEAILLATGNPHKVREVAEILEPMGIALCSPAEVDGLVKVMAQVIEDGDCFAANACKKAEAACAASGLWALADDSGIEARALGGAPGIFSARYAGPECDDLANNRKLMAALRTQTDRHVQYRCVIALARPGLPCLTWDGTFAGEFIDEAIGTGGFGYDPHFFVPDCACTVAQLSASEKHRRSHRGQALRGFAAWLQSEYPKR